MYILRMAISIYHFISAGWNVLHLVSGFDAPIYEDCKTEKLYVRDRKDFFDKFVKLTEYNNGNNSKQGVSEAD